MDERGTRPHTAVLLVHIDVHSLTDKGECSGNVVNEETLSKYNINPTMVFGISGFDRHDCLIKLRAKLEQLHAE